MAKQQKDIPAFEFDKESDLPLWVQLRNRMALLIMSGYYEPDEKLPTVRKYAADLHISYNTVSKAYMGLERDGYVRTVRGSGVYVNKPSDALQAGNQVNSLVAEFVTACVGEGLQYDEIPKLVSAYVRKVQHENAEE